MAQHLRYSAFSHRGYARANNEDSVYAGPRLLALADGMGGHEAGEIASALVIAELAELDRHEADDPLVALHEAVTRANAAIARHVALAHVGDSRAYLLRGRNLFQLTKDETFVQYLVDRGQLTPEGVHAHPQRSILMKVLTGQPLEPTLQIVDVRAGDRYLLCSDGVSDVLPAETLAEALLVEDPQQCAYPLLQLALRAGTRDNVSCIGADVATSDYGYNVPLVGGAASEMLALN
jgi:protein phosphatase